MYAAGFSDTTSTGKTVELLLQYGANPKFQDIYGSTALILAGQHFNRENTERTVELLLYYGANPNLQNMFFGETALTYVVFNIRNIKIEKTVELLLQYGADPNLQNESGWTTIMATAISSNMASTERTVKLLYQYGADPNLQNTIGWTALMYAAQYSNAKSAKKTVKLLLQYGAMITHDHIFNISLNSFDIIKKNLFAHFIQSELNALENEILYRPKGIKYMIGKVYFEYNKGDDLKIIYQNNKKLMTYMDIRKPEEIFFKLEKYFSN
jgi:ankyrin repeat protein